MTIGQTIAAERRKLGLSQEQLGEKMGVTRQSISKWESDAALPRRQNPPRLLSRWKYSSWQSASPGSISGSSPSPGAGPAG